MARLVMPENGAAMPAMSYYSPGSPYAQAPYYLIPQPAHSIPHYSDAPRYGYGPTEYGGSAPGLKLVPPQSYHYPVPVDPPKHEAMKQIPQGFVAPNARHPVYVLPDGTMVGQPVHYNGYPVYDNVSRAHLHPFGGNQQPGGAQYLPVAAPVSETLPAAPQPGMRWKLVPIAEREEDVAPIVSPKASSAPVMLLKSPEEEPDSAVSGPYKKFLSRLLSKSEDESQTKDGQVVGAPEVEVKGDTPKSVRIIPVTDAPKDDPKRAMDQAPGEEGKSSSKENACSSSSLKKQINKSSSPALKPIRLVPALDFVKKKPAAGTSKQEKSTQAKRTCEVKVSAPEEAGSKMVEKRARENFVEDSGSDAERRGDEPSAKKRLITDSETAARLIQSVFRGYLVRRCQPLKHLRDIARVMKEYQALAANRSALLERCKDPAEWMKVSEAIMSLLLRLDVIQGVDPVVRGIRKYTSKEVLKLQSEVDAVKRQREEQVDDLLLQLLERLPSSGQPVDTDLTSEVVKRLSLLKEQEQEKDTDTTAFEKQGGSEIAGENCSDGVQSGMADDAAIDSNLPVSSELQEVAETLTADFVDVVNGRSEDTVDLVQSMADQKEEMLKGQGILDSDDRALLEVCEGLDVSNGMGEEASKYANVESEMEGAPTEIAGTGETQAEKFNVVDGEDKEQTSEVEAHEEKVPDSDLLADLRPDDPASTESACEECSCKESVTAPANEEAATDAYSVTPLADEEKVPISDVIADLKDDPSSTESAYEGCSCKESVTAPANEEAATDAYSVTPLADEEKVPISDVIADLKDDPSSTESAYEGCSYKESLMAPEAATDANSVTTLADEEKVPNTDVIADLKNDPASTEPAYEECNRKESGMAPEAATDADSVTPHADEEKVPNTDVIADLKDDPASTEPACEECNCKESGMAPEAATDSDSVKPLADEEKIPFFDFVDDLKHDPASAKAGFDPPEQSTLSLPKENEDAVEVNAPAEAPPSHSAEGLWNGLDSSCHYVHSSSPCQSFEQDSEDVATEPSHPGVNEPCNTTSTLSNEESENADTVEKSLNIQIPDKSSFSPQEVSVPGDSPTSVLDAGISMAPAASEDVDAETSLDEDQHLMNEKETLQCAISDLESLNNEGECFLHDESLQLESAISDLHSLNNSGQGFLNDLSPDGASPPPSSKRITAEVYLPKPPSLSPEALDLLEHGVESSERLSPSSCTFSPSSETATLTQHLVEENSVLKELLKDLLKWSQWQSAATLGLHQMMEKLALEVLETKATAKKAARCKHGKSNKKAAKKRSHPL